MTETVKKRRRWLWVIAATALLLLGVPLAWQFRPLTAEERALLGTWKSGRWRITYTADRRYRLHESIAGVAVIETFGGRWCASDGRIFNRADMADPLTVKTAVPHFLHQLGLSRHSRSAKMTFDGHDVVRLVPDRGTSSGKPIVRVTDGADVDAGS